MKIFQSIFKILWFFVTVLVLWINVHLYLGIESVSEKRKDIVLQLNFLKKELNENDLGGKMQKIYPEGFIFVNALYGLSWCELALKESDPQFKLEAINEALYAYNEITAPEATWNFDANIYPEYGIFYLSWNNYLLSKLLQMNVDFPGRKEYMNLYESQCNLISKTLQKHNSPFLPSYEGMAWPADMTVAMASLSYNRLLANQQKEGVIRDWIEKLQLNLDPQTKLIPHRVDPNSGAIIEGARGSSSSLMIRLLSEIDPDFAKEQYRQYQTHFVSTTIGLPSVSESPKGRCGVGDIDSGPVIFGVGFAATIVSIGTHAALGNYRSADDQFNTIKAFGFPLKSSNTKRYLFGQLPIADAFIAWSRSGNIIADSNASPFRIYFFLLSMLFIFIGWVLVVLNRKSSINIQQ